MPAPGLVCHVCGPTAGSISNMTSYTLFYPGCQGNGSLPGNLIVVSVTTGASTTITVTDSAGNSYSAGASVSGNQFVKEFYVPNATAGVVWIKFSFSAGQQFVQAKATEFCGIASSSPVDGGTSSTGSATSGTISSGSITTTVDGDLLYHSGWQDSNVNSTTSFTAGSGWQLLDADIIGAWIGGTFAQWRIQTTHGAITPSMTQAPSAHYDCVALAFKTDSTKGTAPTGMYVQHIYHATIGNIAGPWNMQFPCNGNCILVAAILEPDINLSAMSDGNSNSYSFPGASFGNGVSGNLRFALAAAATCTPSMTIKATFTGSVASTSTIVFYDIVGAPSSPLDTTAGCQTAQNTDGTGGSHTLSTVSITPSTSSGFVFAMCGIDNPEPINGVNNGQLVSCVTNPEGSSGDMDENNGWSFQNNTGKAQITYGWTCPNGAAGVWAAMAIALEAPSSADSFTESMQFQYNG